MQSPFRRNVDAGIVIRFHSFFSFFQSHDLMELTADLLHHLLRILIYAQHQHGREHRRNSRSHQNTEKHRGVHDIKTCNQLFSQRCQRHIDLRHIGSQKRNYSKSCRTDGKSLRHSLNRIAGAVQLICHTDSVLSEASHLRQTSGVVHDRTVSVIADDHAYDGKHSHRRHGNSKQSISLSQRLTQLIRGQRGNSDSHHGRKRRNESIRNT